MTSTVTHNDKIITYSENFWTGKKSIFVNGKELIKISKNTYKLENECYSVKGNFLTGVELNDGVQNITVVRKLTTLEYVLCFLPFILVFSGGAVGGVCGAAALIFNATFIRNTYETWKKVLYSIFTTIAAFVCYFIIVFIFAFLFI